MTTHTLSFLLLLGGCFGADAEPSAPAPERASEASSVAGRSGDGSNDPDLRTCIGDDAPAEDVELHDIGHASLPEGELVETLWMADEAAVVAPNGAVVVVRGSACHVLSADDPDAVWRIARELQSDPATRDRGVAAQIEAAGGLDAFRAAIEAYRGEDWIRPRECGPNEPIAEGLCLLAPEAAAWRRAGLDVPLPHLGAATNPALDLRQVPERLHTCLPPSLRDEQEATDVEVLYTQTNGPEETVVLATYPDGQVVPEGTMPDIVVARTTSEVACGILFDSRTESWADAPGAPLARNLAESPEFRRQRTETEVRRGGGPDGYLRLYREQTRTQGPTACPTSPPAGYEGRCAGPIEAETLRRLGVPVAAPR